MGRCKLRAEWFEKIDDNSYKVAEWCKKHTDDEVFCIVCSVKFNITSKGYQAIQQHTLGSKHKMNCCVKLTPRQLRLSTSLPGKEQNKNSSSIHLFSINDQATVAEVMWTLKCVASNFSFFSCDDIGDLFSTMFPESFPKGFCLNRTKATYIITDALGPYFKEELIKDIGNSYYSIMYDDTTNSAGKKELQVLVRYFSSSNGQVVSRHLETFFIGKATADILKSKIILALDNANLPIKNLLMLGSDGPNVNKKVFRVINEHIRVYRNKSMIDIGTCNIHVVHNTYLKGLNKFGMEASQLIIAIYHYFDGWPARWEYYSVLQKKLGVSMNHFIKHVPSRWLTLEGAAERVIQQWSSIEAYFLKFIPSMKPELMNTSSYKHIKNLLNISTIKCELIFAVSSAKMFTNFTRYLQKEEPLVHIMYSELCSLVCTILLRICPAEKVSLNELESMNNDFFENKDNLLSVHDLIISENILTEFTNKKVSEKHILLFKSNCQMHYIEACKHILKTSSLLTKPLLKYLNCLNPINILNNDSYSNLMHVAKVLPFDIPLDNLVDEWKLLQFEEKNIFEEFDKTENARIDVFWMQFIKKKTVNQNEKYPNLSKVVKATLALVHGSAEIERNFSLSGKILTDNRSSLSERTLNALLCVNDALKLYNNKPQLVIITKEIITLARGAHKHYQQYLEDKKKQTVIAQNILKEQQKKELEHKENVKKALLKKKNN